MNRIKSKLQSILEKIVKFYKQNFLYIVLLIILLPFFIAARKLQYINIIPNYYYYVIGFYLFLIIILFGKQISVKKLYIAVLGIIVIALIASIAELFFPTISADSLGFIIFVLILVTTISDFFTHKKNLKIPIHD